MKLSYRKLSILIVDQVSTGQDTLKTYLDDFQFYRTWTAQDVESALKILKEKPVNLVVTAWKMQPQSGFQLLQRIRANEKTRELPVLLMIDRKDKALEQKGLELGASGFLNTPLAMEPVRLTVAQMLDEFVDEEEETFMQHMTKARKAMRLGKLDQAEENYQNALKVKSSKEAMLGLGRILKQKGDMEAAATAFISALRLEPKSLRAFLGLASVYNVMGRKTDALKVLAGAVMAAKKLKKSGKVTASLHFYMGELELQLKQLRKAMDHFHEATDDNPKDTDLQVKMGDALSDSGHFAESEEFYQRALELDPELAHVYNRLGISYRKQKKFDLALNLFGKALNFHPQDEHLLYNMAHCLWDMNSLEKSTEYLSRALKLNPEFKEAQVLLDAVLNKLGYKVSEGAPPSPPTS